MWKKDFEVQNNIINKQHMKLFNIIDKIYDLYLTENLRDDIRNIIIELKDYTAYHFTTEETIYELNKLDYFEHKLEHNEFIKKIKSFEEKFIIENFNFRFITEMNSYLLYWLSNHIYIEDKKMFNKINEKSK